MVEVSHNSNSLSEDPQNMASLVYKMLSSLEPPDAGTMRRVAATKRSIIRSHNRPNSSRLSPTEGDRKISPSGLPPKSPHGSLGSVEDDTKRLRPELGLSCTNPVISDTSLKLDSAQRPKSLFFRRVRNHSAPLYWETDEQSPNTSFPEIQCQISRLSKPQLKILLEKEPQYHPNNAFLYYVDPVVEDKVDAILRNEAVHNLRFMHNAFFTLSAETFCKAVNLIDRFIVKVKVKPKYVSCVAAAAYYVAAKLSETTSDIDLPCPDALVQISRCGGSAADLIRMEEILMSKLGGNLDGVNAFDFLKFFASTAVILPDSAFSDSSFTFNEDDELFDANSDMVAREGSQPLISANEYSRSLPEDSSNVVGSRNRKINDLWTAMAGRLVVALCSLEIYRYRPATVALSVFLQFKASGISSLARMCNVDMQDVRQCSTLVEELYDVYYRDPHPSSRKTLIWTLSRRTLFRIGCSSPTPLDTISEDCETDKEDNLQFLFEP